MTAPRNWFDESIARGTLEALELAVYELGSDGLYRCVGPLPNWFQSILPEGADVEALDLSEVFPYLGVFFAELPELERQSEACRSDTWREQDRAGREVHVQALALKVDGKRVIALESPAGAYEHQSERQRANQAALDKAKIERLSRDLKARTEEAERATRAKSEFLATMSHEIRTPMNAIIGMADAMYQTPLSKEQRKYVEVFQRAGENLLGLINAILDLSKVESGKMELERADFDLDAALAKAVEIIQVRAAAKHLTVQYKIAPAVPGRLIGDPGRLQQVLVNLLGNSMKFTEQGGLEVAVDLDPEGKEPGALRFAVSDTGIGIPADKLDLIFEDFTQADSSTTRKYGGTGLGLSISRHLVELMQGRIWVTSQVGKGSTFYFTGQFGLQADQSPAAHPPAAAQSTSQPPTDAALRISPGLRILLADDSDDNRFLIQSYLKNAECILETAENGRIAYEMFQRGAYDLVLMDVEMPEMDGYTATRMIRGREKDSGTEPTPILALTAHAFQEAVERSLAAGFSTHLTKPIRRATLLEALSKWAPSRPGSRAVQNVLVMVDPALEALVPNYLDKRRQDLVKFAAALEGDDFETLRRLGHNLKGTGAGYGFDKLTEIGGEIEAGAKANNRPAVQVKVDELARYLENVRWSAGARQGGIA
jgi:signal transduction histidine kinase/DNA-binding NarL/FixJ family response regulator